MPNCAYFVLIHFQAPEVLDHLLPDGEELGEPLKRFGQITRAGLILRDAPHPPVKPTLKRSCPSAKVIC